MLSTSASRSATRPRARGSGEAAAARPRRRPTSTTGARQCPGHRPSDTSPARVEPLPSSRRCAMLTNTRGERRHGQRSVQRLRHGSGHEHGGDGSGACGGRDPPGRSAEDSTARPSRPYSPGAPRQAARREDLRRLAPSRCALPGPASLGPFRCPRSPRVVARRRGAARGGQPAALLSHIRSRDTPAPHDSASSSRACAISATKMGGRSPSTISPPMSMPSGFLRWRPNA